MAVAGGVVAGGLAGAAGFCLGGKYGYDSFNPELDQPIGRPDLG